MLKYWLKFSPFKKKWVEFFTSSTESSEANENLTYHHTFRMKRNILLICLLGILFHWHFSVKKKKIVRLRFSYSFVYVDSTRFQLASSMIMKNFCTTLFICILDIYSAILLAIVSNLFLFFGTFGCHLFTDIPNFVIQIQSVGNMKLIFAYEPYFNFGCMKYQSTVLTMYLTIVGIFYK